MSMPVAGRGSATPVTSGHPKAYAEPVTLPAADLVRSLTSPAAPRVAPSWKTLDVMDRLSRRQLRRSSTVDSVLIRRTSSSDETG
jgi:hypothetical protein